MIFAAVLAGGSGSRMGNTEKPKQFLEIGGKPVIVHTVEKFLKCDAVDRVLVVTPAEWVDYTMDILSKAFCKEAKGHGQKSFEEMAGELKTKVAEVAEVAVLAGGPTRNETLMNAIRYIDEEGCLDDETIIVTQDAVRPFVTDRMIRENIEAVRRSGACETAFPATDTIVESDDGTYVATVPDRSRLWMTQTPQSFRAKQLRELYLSLSDEEKTVLTDAAKIYVIKGLPVEIVMGSADNMKITYPHDIQIAEAILSARNQE